MRKIISMLIVLLNISTISAQETAEQKDASRRSRIESFLKTYQASYEKKNKVFIKSFFSDDALIITETMKLKPTGSKETVPSTKKNRPYETIVENRRQYIDRLFKIFDSNNPIRLCIPEKTVVIRQHAKYPEIYGVNFKQMWITNNGDDNLESQMPGYIFLMIDFKHLEKTIIHVRTWQPEDNIKKPSDKYFLRDFMIYETK